MTKRPFAFAVIVAAIGVVLAGVAAATPPFGIISNTIVARAAFLDRVNLRFAIKDDHHGRESIHVRNAADTAMQQIVFAPNGHTGWHSHPGPAVALVISGELTIYSGDDPACKGRTFSAGQAFIDSGQGHVHLGANRSQSETVVWVTYFDVPPGEGVRLDAAAPGNCPF